MTHQIKTFEFSFTQDFGFSFRYELEGENFVSTVGSSYPGSFPQALNAPDMIVLNAIDLTSGFDLVY